MITDGLIYFTIFLVVAIPLGLLSLFFLVVLTLHRRDQKAFGFIVAAVITLFFGVLLSGTFKSAYQLLYIMSRHTS